jgi:hypothetical protein
MLRVVSISTGSDVRLFIAESVVAASQIVPLILIIVSSDGRTVVIAPFSRHIPQPIEPESVTSFRMSIIKIPEIWPGAKAFAIFIGTINQAAVNLFQSFIKSFTW